MSTVLALADWVADWHHPGATRRQLNTWVAASDWKVEFRRRVAVVAGVDETAVTLTNYEDTTSGTVMTFSIQPALMTDAAYAALKSRIEGVSTTSFLTAVLGVPITSIMVALGSEVSPPPPPPSPGEPPSPPSSNKAVVPGVIVAAVVPSVLVVLLAIFAVWYYRRRKKRIGNVTVIPNRELVAPPSVPQAEPLMASAPPGGY